MNSPIVGVKLPVSGKGSVVGMGVILATGVYVGRVVGSCVGLVVGVCDGFGVRLADGVETKAGPSDA